MVLGDWILSPSSGGTPIPVDPTDKASVYLRPEAMDIKKCDYVQYILVYIYIYIYIYINIGVRFLKELW
jgi:hypothetical protein